MKPSRYYGSLALVIAAGAYWRLRDFDLAAFNIDEAIASIYCIQFVFKGDLPLIGVKTSLHFYNSPLLIYLLAPFYSISTSPLFAQSLAAALGIALIWLAAGMGRRVLGDGWGLMMAVFTTFSIVGVLTSRRLWGHAFIPFLSTLVFYHTWLWIARGRARSLYVVACAILWAQQLHFSGSLLWVCVILTTLLFRPRLPVRYFAAGLLAGFIPYIPYIVKTGYHDLMLIARYMIIGADAAVPSSVSPAIAALQWFGDLGRNDMLGTTRNTFVKQIPAFRVITFVCPFVAAIGIATSVAQWKRIDVPGPVRLVLAMSVIWTAVPLIAFSLTRVTFVPFYLLPSMPGPFMLFVLAAYLSNRRWCRAWLVYAVVVMLWGAGQMLYMSKMYSVLATADMSQPIQTCLRYRQQAIRHIAGRVRGDRALVVQPGRPPDRGVDYAYSYLIWRELGEETERLFDRRKPSRLFILRDSKEPLQALPEDQQSILKQSSCRIFGNIAVYELNAGRLTPEVRRIFGLMNAELPIR